MSAFPLCAVGLRAGFLACTSRGKSDCDRHDNAKTGVCTTCEGGRLVELPPR